MRLAGLDFLRGIAVILVIFRHFELIEFLGNFGWAGVDLFFVLSGFLVSGLLFYEYKKFGDIKPGLFLLRRGFKIYPLFYFLIGLTCVKSLVVYALHLPGNKNFSTGTLLSEIFFVQNYFDRIWKHTWSLAVEEHFYLLLTLFIFLLIRFNKLENRKFFVVFSILIFSTTLFLRYINFSLHEFSYNSHIFRSHLRFDSLFFGVFLSYNYHFSHDTFIAFFKKNRNILSVIAILAITPCFIWPLDNFFIGTFGLTLLYVGFGILLIKILLMEDMFNKPRSLVSKLAKPISFIGFYSYSIYLWHIPVKAYVYSFLSKYIVTTPVYLRFGIYLFLCVGAGYVASRLIEIPALRYRELKFPKRTLSA